jgi:hypothetical protein
MSPGACWHAGDALTAAGPGAQTFSMWRALAGAHLVLAAACLSAPGGGGAEPGPGATSDGAPASACDDPAALTHAGHCYLRHQTTGFEEAETGCEELGGYLVVLDDLDEQVFVAGAFDVSAVEAWLGLRRTAGDWHWINGAPLSWTDWGPTAPSNDSGYDCALLDFEQGDCADGCWDNDTCLTDELLQAICEVEL